MDGQRPLYNLGELRADPDRRVLVVEGERTADAAAGLFADMVVVTSAAGAKAAAKTDWSPLKGRKVVIWPDRDDAGAGYAKTVLDHVPHAKVVHVPTTFPEHWDLADKLPATVRDADLHKMINDAGKDATNEAKPLPRTTSSISSNGKAPESPQLKARETAAKALADKYCDKAGNPISEKELKERVAGMDNVSYDRERRAIAAGAGVRASTLDKLREEAQPAARVPEEIVIPDDVRTRLLEQHARAAAHIIAAPNVLELLVQETRKVIAGEEDAVRLLYLVATSRLFPKPMNAVIKGLERGQI
jgi:DNA primase